MTSQTGGEDYYASTDQLDGGVDGGYSVAVANDTYKLTNLEVMSEFSVGGVLYSNISAMEAVPEWDIGPFVVDGDTTQDYILPEYVEVSGSVVDSNGVGIAGLGWAETTLGKLVPPPLRPPMMAFFAPSSLQARAVK